jgi:excisionase family DNA binding protein
MPLTTDEVARHLRLHRYTVQRWLREGRLRGINLGGRAGWRIPESELKRILDEERAPGMPESTPTSPEEQTPSSSNPRPVIPGYPTLSEDPDDTVVQGMVRALQRVRQRRKQRKQEEQNR